MMHRKYKLLFCFVCLHSLLLAQDTTLLLSGPMLGYAEHREVLIWIEVTPTVNTIQIRYHEGTNPDSVRSVEYKGELDQEYNPVKLILENLEMNTTYTYEIYLNGKKQVFPYSLSFKTKEIWEWRKPAPDFSFLFGSCAYINDPLSDRPGEIYGRNPRILDTMGKVSSDFMLWLGDNTYTREGDWTSRSGFYYRYTHSRKCRNMQRLLASRPNYAIWDDHDYGPNDANGSFELKEVSLQAFRDFWGNKTFGEEGNPGVYNKFTWSDCEFFLLDDRYYRSDNKTVDSMASKKFLGERQMEWLKNGLLYSSAAFKFVCVGNQVLNPLNDYECFRLYKEEYNELLNFIRDYKIAGVIFLTGDRHLSEIIKVQPEGSYPLYDITSSPLTSGSFSNFKTHKEFNNPYRVVPSAVLDQNFLKISIRGDRNNRTATIDAINADNRIVWEYVIKQTELKF